MLYHAFFVLSIYVLFPGKIFQALDRMGHVDEIVNDPEYELLFFYDLLHLNVFISV